MKHSATAGTPATRALALLLVAAWPGANAALGRGRGFRLRSAASGRQPLRCLTSTCVEFGHACETDENCITDRCYNGKCAQGPLCRAENKPCYQYAAQTCCTGQCTPVLLYSDCLKLLGIEADVQTHAGINVDRQCEAVGVCAAWPDSQSPTALATPWAVLADDEPSKYYDMGQLTFAAGVAPIASLFVGRRMGETHTGVAAAETLPGAVRDAGVLIFTDDSTVETTQWSSYVEGIVTYCVAPIVQGGVGGSFFAAGRNCCLQGKFECGDLTAKSGLVLAGPDAGKYAQALEKLKAEQGTALKASDAVASARQILPTFLLMEENYVEEQKKPPIGYTFVVPGKSTHCVAPIWKAGEAPKGAVGFFAVGVDCCSQDVGFHCGAVDDTSAHSGEVIQDLSGEFRQTAVMLTQKAGIEMAARPIFVSWAAGTLVAPP